MTDETRAKASRGRNVKVGGQPADGTTELIDLGHAWLTAPQMTLERSMFGLAERVQDVATAVLMHILGKSPRSHIFSSVLRAIRIAHKSEIALGGESRT